MQVVIDIPEHYYENNIKKELPICLTEEQVVAILPKGHGALIDVDQIPGDGGWDFSDRLMSTPIIIEADTK